MTVIDNLFGTGGRNAEFDRLIDEARSYIPRYAPQWTDHNVHDPGMTLLDLLAWLVDQQLYRVGFVNDRHLLAFAALLGHRPQEATAARGTVWPSGPITSEITLAVDTEIVNIDRPKPGFVIERETTLTTARLVDARLVDGDVSTPLELSAAAPVNIAVEYRNTGAARVLEMRFDRPLIGVEGGSVSMGFAVEPNVPSPEGPSSAQPSVTPMVDSTRLQFEYRIGDGPWNPVGIEGDRTRGLNRSGVVGLAIGPVAPGHHHATAPSELKLVLDPELMAPRLVLYDVVVNALPVAQTESIGPRELGRGNGLPCQTFPLDTRGLLKAKAEPGLIITVDGEPWDLQPDFARSLPEHRHVVVGPDAVTFGNGVNGRIVRPGAVVAHRAFRRTAGDEGNLPIGGRWRLPALGPSVFGTNRYPIAGGNGEEAPEDALARARTEGTTRAVALTNHQLAAAARGGAGPAVARVAVLPRFDPRLPDTPVDGIRTVVVVPERSADTAVAEVYPIDEQLLERVRAALERARPVGERLQVIGATATTVDVSLSIAVEPGCQAELVAGQVEDLIRHRLTDVVRPSAAEPVEPWPLGRPVTVGELQMLATSVAGVARVTAATIGGHRRADAEADADDAKAGDSHWPLPLGPTELAVAGTVTIGVDSDGEAEPGRRS